MSFLSNNPMEREQEQTRPNYVQGGPMAQSKPGLGSMLAETAKTKGIDMVMEGPMQAASTALLGTAPVAATTTAAGIAVPAVAGTGAIGSLAGMGALGASAAPMLAAMGPFALAALPFLLNNGTSSVPSQDFGPDPLAMGYNNGTKRVPGYNNGSMGVKPTTNMGYAGGTDSVPALLTPGEAIIPAAAAQNPVNKPMIDSMVSEGRAANQMAKGGPMSAPQQAMPEMAGPLSGKGQREQVKLLQEMSLKKKAFEADEKRKQIAFEQKIALDKQKALMSMQT